MTIPLRGGKELDEFLTLFPVRLQKGAVRAGLTAAARPVRDQARQNVAKESGKTAKAIKTGSSRVHEDGTVRITVRLKGEHSHLGHWLEYGVLPHIIDPGDSGVSARLLTRRARNGGIEEREHNLLKIGNSFIGGAVMHPGFAAMPFLRPALDMRADDAINAFGQRVNSYLSSKAGFTAPYLETEEAA